MRISRKYIVPLVTFMAGVWLIVADEVFFWYGALDRDYYYWPFGIKTDVWLAWEISWAIIVICFGILAFLSLRIPGPAAPGPGNGREP